MKENRKVLGSALLLLTALIWGMAFAAQRAGMEDIGPLSFTAARMLLAAAAVGLVSRLMRRGKSAGDAAQSPEETAAYRRGTLLGGLCCGLVLTAASLFQQYGVVYTTAGKAGFLTAMYMLIVPVVEALCFRKKYPRTVWLAVAVGVAGMYLLCVKDGLRLGRGDLLVCICAFMFSGHILCCDHFARRGDPIRIAAIQFAVVTLISGVLAVCLEKPQPEAFAAAALPILYCGLLSCGLGYTLQLTAQRFTDPAVASLLLSLESVFAVIGGALLLGERMSGRELFGCLVLFAAIVLVQIPAPGKTKAE